jgi:hypothetical protein
MPDANGKMTGKRNYPANPTQYPVRPSDPTALYALSEMQVMRSAAGYYLGRAAWDEEHGFAEPGSRESGYFATRAEAERELKSWNVGLEQRDCIENEWAYEAGELPDPKVS